MLTIHAVAFVGRSGSGKTTLIERLIPQLVAQDVRVGVVKHSPIHAVKIDASETDTYRFWASGADHVVLAARDRVMHTHRYDAEPNLSAVLAGVYDVDLILVEGFKRSDLPKVEVIRRACDPLPIEGLAHRIAAATDVEDLVLGCPKFGLGQVSELTRFLIAMLFKEGASGTLG